jgi:hypothetical protein
MAKKKGLWTKNALQNIVHKQLKIEQQDPTKNLGCTFLLI